ncbi:hypothetical protein [Paenibacillus sp. USHLN196]|uniref:hypothetical protein n=1 Tax=Paenibacillus sp. USHLN196 TaxID=3081291 RepID=UPI00301B25CA
MANKITLEALKQNQTKTKEFDVTDVSGNEYTVQMDTIFLDSKIERIVVDYGTYLTQLQSEIEIDDEVIRMTSRFIDVLVMREFTDIPIPKKVTVLELIGLCITLEDSGIISELKKHVDKKEEKKIHNRFRDFEKQYRPLFVGLVNKAIK